MNILTNILVLTLILLILAITAIIAYFGRKLYLAAIDFITPAEIDKPSSLALLTDTFCTMLARAVVIQAKTTLMGMQSGQVRAEKAIAGDLAEGMAEQSPVGVVLKSFPALRKTLRRNPQLVDIALGLLNRSAAGGSAGRGDNGQVRFKL